MLLQEPNLQIWLYAEPTDMRKQFDGLAALAKNKMAGQLQQDQLFVFINRKRTQMKALYYSKGGLCLWAKRLERGHFNAVLQVAEADHKIGLNWAQFHCLIEGIQWEKVPKSRRFIA